MKNLNLKEGKELNFEDDHFIANGIKYYYYGDIEKFGIGRWFVWEDLEPIITFGITSMNIHKEVGTAIKLINENKQVHGHKVLLDLYERLDKNLDTRIDPILKGCTLFMVEEGEDLTEWNETKAKQKIANWRKEGIAYQSFFSFVMIFIPGYLERSREISQASLKKKKKSVKSQSTKKE